MSQSRSRAIRHELESKDGCSWKLHPIGRRIEREIATLGCRGSTPSNDRPMQRSTPNSDVAGDLSAPGMAKPLGDLVAKRWVVVLPEQVGRILGIEPPVSRDDGLIALPAPERRDARDERSGRP
jgi:hypothetical protein